MRCWFREANVIFLNGPVEVPVLLRRVDVADDLDVAHVAAAEPELVREADELESRSGSKPMSLAATASMAT